MDRNVYLGPYVVVLIPVTRRCVDPCAEHDVPTGAAYCPTCGRSRNQPLCEEWVEDIEFHEVTGEALMTTTDASKPERVAGHFMRRYYAISNVEGRGPKPRVERDFLDNDVAASLLSVDMEAEMQAFRDEFASEIAALASAGAIAQCSWGLLLYVS